MVALAVRQGIVSNPVQLTVGKATRLLLNVTRDPASSNHTIQGWLKYGSTSQGVPDRTISIKVNETLYSVKTDTQGHFLKVLGLQTINNSTSTPYTISASFEGDAAVTATAEGKTLDGQDYPACTTIQYNDYKPSANSTSLIVEPTSSPITTPTQTPEQLQQYGIDLGWLKTWVEFSLSYPWFRMHVKVQVSVAGLDLWFHVGMSPLLPDSGVIEWSPDLAKLFQSLNGEVLTEMVAEIGTLFGMYIAAKTASLAAEIPTQQYLEIVAVGLMIAKFTIQAGFWVGGINDKVQMLASAIVNLLLALLATFRIDVILMFIANVGIGMTLAAWNALNAMGWLIRGFCDTVDDAVRSLPSWVTIMDVIFDVIFFELSQWRFFQL